MLTITDDKGQTATEAKEIIIYAREEGLTKAKFLNHDLHDTLDDMILQININTLLTNMICLSTYLPS